jgi:adenylate cyclase
MTAIQSTIDWLVDGARSCTRSEDVLAELCERMIGAGVPLWRAAVLVTTLHPDVMGRRFMWQASTGVTTSEALFDVLETDEFRNSPFSTVYTTNKPVRRRLADADCPDDFAILRDLRAEGATDYAAFPLAFSDGSIHVATWSTRQAGGLTQAQLGVIERVIAPLARVAEIRALRRTAANLLDTYVGNQAGERILAGKIRRGHVDTIGAAIWLSDMRGFTALSERVPPQQLVDHLNRYFDCQVPAIHRHGGEVLKFMGDGLLAIFPFAGGDAGGACRRALAAALAARELVDRLGLPASNDREDVARFGLALHVGNVMYGNIGGGDRLDFTCIGPAVNLAARLEKIASSVGRTIVASVDFARHVPDRFAPLGDFAVAGFAASHAVFGLAERSR